MFKKKFVLPPKPQIPSQEQMVLDIANMNNDDPVLTSSNIVSRASPNIDPSENAYQKLNSFLELHQDLSKAVTDLKTLCESAAVNGKDVNVLAETLQKQAAVLQKEI